MVTLSQIQSTPYKGVKLTILMTEANHIEDLPRNDKITVNLLALNQELLNTNSTFNVPTGLTPTWRFANLTVMRTNTKDSDFISAVKEADGIIVGSGFVPKISNPSFKFMILDRSDTPLW
ncbi:unnamed protein product [Leptosia nina]|uniref:Uncharacterized protein n=1 Tax=Leptosia nina TaxID=320188 RepID=A0AAV1J5U4_9NEOP